VGVVIPDISNRFFAAALQSIARTVRRQGYEILVGSTEGDPEFERRAVEVLATKRVDGLIVAQAGGTDTEHLTRLTKDGTALVLLDRAVPEVPRASFVSVDNIEASRLAVEHLIRLGHRDIAIVSETRFDPALAAVGDAAGLRPSAMRLAGYVRAMSEAGLTVRPEHIVHSEYSSTMSYEVTRALLRDDPRVTAIYCTDNVLSAGAFAAVQDSGLRCPQDVSLVGFDDHEWATLVRPRLTVVEQPTEAIGGTAADYLLRAIADPSREPVTGLLPARLVVRDSTAAPGR
jgi:LacI family transcriptional regulator, galactose operon repressor